MILRQGCDWDRQAKVNKMMHESLLVHPFIPSFWFLIVSSFHVFLESFASTSALHVLPSSRSFIIVSQQQNIFISINVIFLSRSMIVQAIISDPYLYLDLYNQPDA